MARTMVVNEVVRRARVQPCRIAVEEEFHLVDTHTRHLAVGAARVLRGLPDDGRFKPELLDSAVEINSRIHDTLGSLRADLAASRSLLVAAAAPHGLAPVAAGTVPLADPSSSHVVHDERMERMRAEYALVAEEQLICGAQVQVDCPDRELRVRAMARLQPWLPVLLALTASSPYWRGVDTGYASYRTLVWRRWPTSGPSPRVASVAQYDALVDSLVASGAILDRGMIYFDVRPSQVYPTLEVRLCDAVPRLDDVLLLAGLSRALVETAVAEVVTGLATDDLPEREIVEAARWRAARSGLDGDLLDPVTSAPVPAAAAVSRLLDHLEPALEVRGDREQVAARAAAVLAGGPSARRQRQAREAGSLQDVVDQLVRETRDTDLDLNRGCAGEANRGCAGEANPMSPTPA